MDTYVFSQAILLKGQIYVFSITTLKFQVSRKLPPMKIAPQSGPGFGLGLALELGLGGGGNFPGTKILLLTFIDHIKTKDYYPF